MSSPSSSVRYAIFAVLFLVVARAGLAQTINVDVANPTHAIPSTLWGVFFEEINLGGDGGLYAELVRNRSFNNSASPDYWTLVTTGSATGSDSVIRTGGLNVTNTASLQITMSSTTGTVGAANGGYFGIPLVAGSNYNLNLYLTGSAGFTGPVSVALQSSSGTLTYAQTSFTGLSGTWQKFSATLTPTTSDTNSRLLVSINQKGTVRLATVSLFPAATFNNHANGLRPDLAGMVQAMHPSFLRFPGGNFIEGTTIATAERWKTTIGDISVRPGHWNSAWSYLSTDGLGMLEYLQFCEDLGMLPVFDINSGQSLGATTNSGTSTTIPLSQMGPWVQDAPDAVQYMTGGTNTVWGATRAANGHPGTFQQPTVEIGNETSGTNYDQRYALFYAALTGSYPGIRMISPNWQGVTEKSEPQDIIDEHYYTSPATFEGYSTKYDSYPRPSPNIFVGEYAVTSGYGTYGNMAAALGEASFMTGMERNSDVVLMASYAPLFGNVNNLNWKPDAIYYDNTRTFGTPSYYNQMLFANNTGSAELPVTIDYPPSASTTTYQGGIGLATWSTQSEYNNLVVSDSNGQTIYQSNFATTGTAGWSALSGSWAVSATDGALQQTANDDPDMALYSGTSTTNWTNYSFSLQARKISGNEGFLVMFYVRSADTWVWWNVGGWTNTMDGIENEVAGSKTTLTNTIAPGATFAAIATGQWYTIKVVVNGASVQCYLNGVLTQQTTLPAVAATQGGIGCATYNTQDEFQNMTVTGSDGSTLYSYAASGTAGWTNVAGTWTISSTDGALQQSNASSEPGMLILSSSNTNWTNYTYSLQVRKTSGSEGFIIPFYVSDANDYCWWNVGGWTNTADGIQQAIAGTRTVVTETLAPGVSFAPIQSGTWYNVTIQVNGNNIACYLNGVLTQTATLPPLFPIYTSASVSPATHEVIVKAVNPNYFPYPATINLKGLSSISSTAPVTVLSAPSSLTENSFAAPLNVAPVSSTVSTPGTQFSLNLPAYSVTALRVQAPVAQPQGVTVTSSNGMSVISWSGAAGASSYIVQRASSASGPWAVVGSGTGQSFIDTGAQPGAVYYYTVTGSNAAGTSTSSTDIVAMPVPPVPNILSQGGSVMVTVSSTAGVNYQLQQTSSLSQPSWSNFGAPVPGTGQTLQWTATNGILGSPGYYRFNLTLPSQ